MDRFIETEARFQECLQRARGVCELQEYLSVNHTGVLDTTDMLRAAVVLCVSAFDFLIYETFCIEVLHRYRGRRSMSRFHIPFDVTIVDPSEAEAIIENHVRETNSYKSFVDPRRYSDAMGCFVSAPWDRMAAKLGRDPSLLKQRVRAIYRWRNRIAHEADINPVLAGVELWPIEKRDVIDAINDFEEVGLASIAVLRES